MCALIFVNTFISELQKVVTSSLYPTSTRPGTFILSGPLQISTTVHQLSPHGSQHDAVFYYIIREMCYFITLSIFTFLISPLLHISAHLQLMFSTQQFDNARPATVTHRSHGSDHVAHTT